jgi:hypothetical protein
MSSPVSKRPLESADPAPSAQRIKTEAGAVPVKTPVVYIQVLGEENASHLAYVLRLEDLPGGTTEELNRQLKRGPNPRPKYLRGEPTDVDWKTLSEADLACHGDIIAGFMRFKAIHTLKSMTDVGYEPKDDEVIVCAMAAFEDL